MAKKIETRGRPKASNPMEVLISFRITKSQSEALEKYRSKLNVAGLSANDAARDAVLKTLKSDGLIDVL